MKHRNKLPEQSLQAAAAAVLLALGSSVAVAQQEAEDPASPQSAEEQQRSAQQSAQPDEGAAQQEETQIARAGDTGPAGSADLDQLAEEHADLAHFVEAVKAAGMEDSLTDGTKYTVFAPTDEALEEMSGMDLEELMRPENRDQLVSMLRAHIVADEVDAEMARSLRQAQTIDGGTIDISESDGELMVGDARVVEPDVRMGSLTVHSIDQVLSHGRTQTVSAEGQPQEQEQESGIEQELEQDELERESESESVLR